MTGALGLEALLFYIFPEKARSQTVTLSTQRMNSSGEHGRYGVLGMQGEWPRISVHTFDSACVFGPFR